jgi:hypothetical protein
MERARGMSHIILHYVRDAPLCGIADWDACEEHQLVIAHAGALAPEPSSAISWVYTNGKEHCIRVGDDLSTLPLLWRTRGGWKFGQQPSLRDRRA